MRFATYVAGACSSMVFLHTTGVFDWIASVHFTLINNPLAIIDNISPWQKGTGTLLLLWLAAYPISRINIYLGNAIIIALECLLGPLWVSQYSSDGGIGYLPSIEVPTAAGVAQRKDNKGAYH